MNNADPFSSLQFSHTAYISTELFTPPTKGRKLERRYLIACKKELAYLLCWGYKSLGLVFIGSVPVAEQHAIHITRACSLHELHDLLVSKRL